MMCVTAMAFHQENASIRACSAMGASHTAHRILNYNPISKRNNILIHTTHSEQAHPAN
jgi:hypothetical protein